MAQTQTTIEICPAAELPPGASRIVEVDGRKIGIELSPTRLKCGLLSLKVVQGALLGTDEWPTGTPEEDPDAAEVARLRNEI